MVKSILAGNKTQTRRIIKPKFTDSVFEINRDILCETEPPTPSVKLPNGMTRHKVRQFVPCTPRYNAGDALYVRETWLIAGYDGSDAIYCYRADDEIGCGNGRNNMLDDNDKWKPSIHMPKSAARIFLRMTAVRAERLQDISDDDCIAEGLTENDWLPGDKQDESSTIAGEPADEVMQDWGNYIGAKTKWARAYAHLWSKINDKCGDGHYWADNPWVWVYKFERMDFHEQH